ncbi:DUF4177 domain-containing protein [Desulforhabdus amnigena]|jgi:hypothetical protein|uniref:DUF4177 domain-containing protein n=1 Tax=Desulforhabdus amnigena TaxID=40218 RepID=A0A9W6LAI2_9BACT|nr:DUF4177 domain-containing protein [Desulforhabdus amnigena]NLJ29875.1 DUF4177 domain-containing protein [Deltaproteobacteria bacterium]GLI36254.1 hypothetical protein DAMNIGENAA_36870 [Desulforhabdus amnigena]
MKKFEYEITRHPAEYFREFVYFCSQDGACGLEEVPSAQTEKMQTILNEQGRKGWELVQVAFGKEGIMAFWKRMLIDNE